MALKKRTPKSREGIIIPLLRCALFYYWGAVVDEGPKVDLVYYGTLVYYGKGVPEQRVP